MRLALVIVLTGALLAGPAAAETFTFHWPVPSKVQVTEKVVKGGVPATLRYDVSLTAAPDRKRLALRLGHFEFLDVAGRDAHDPALRKQLAEALRAASAVPTVLITREGRFDDIADFEAVIDKLNGSSRMSPSERAAAARMMKSPQMLAAARDRSADFWSIWVGMWVGSTLEPGRTLQLSQTSQLPDGSSIERPLTVVHHGPAGPPQNVRLSFTSALEGRRDRKALQGLVDGFLQQAAAATGKPIPAEMVEDVEMVIEGEVVTNPSDLRPASARSSRSVTLKLKGEPPHAEVEIHDYTFTWPKVGRGT